jgi:hypothetical protein
VPFLDVGSVLCAVLYDLEEWECPSGREYGREKGNIGAAAVARVPGPFVVAYVWLPSSVFKGRCDGVIVLDPKAEVVSVTSNGNKDRCFRSELAVDVVDCWSGCCFCT